jgi:hypothetical protein
LPAYQARLPIDATLSQVPINLSGTYERLDNDPAAVARRQEGPMKSVSGPALSFDELMANFLRPTRKEGGFVSSYAGDPTYN